MNKPNAFTVPRGSAIAQQLEKHRTMFKTLSKAQHIVIPPSNSYHATQKLMKAAI